MNRDGMTAATVEVTELQYAGHARSFDVIQVLLHHGAIEGRGDLRALVAFEHMLPSRRCCGCRLSGGGDTVCLARSISSSKSARNQTHQGCDTRRANILSLASGK